MRVGFGYDIHRLVKKRKLVIGGVVIPALKGELGFSDGDVLIHAVIDSLLGASGSKDIGTFFPPGDPAYKDISSRILLREIAVHIKSLGFTLVNLDCTVILEQPKLKPHIDSIIAALAEDLQITAQQVTVKAKTNEKLGYTARGKAIEAYAVVLLE